MKIYNSILIAGVSLILSLITGKAVAQDYKWVKGTTSTDITTGKIAKDKEGNVYTSGSFLGNTDMDFSGLGGGQLYGGGAFLAKYDADGAYLWSYKLGNGADSLAEIRAIHTDELGNVYIAGMFSGIVDFDPSEDVADTAFEQSSSSFGDGYYDLCMFVAKYDANGNFVWVMNLVGGSYSDFWDMAIKNDKVYITGGISTYAAAVDGLSDVDFNPSKLPADTFYLSGEGMPGVNEFELNPFFAVYDLDAGLLMAKRIYGSPEFKGYAIDADVGENIYVCGGLRGNHDLDPSLAEADTFFIAGEYGIFISSYNSEGNFRWASPVLHNDNIGFVFPDNPVLMTVHNDDIYIAGLFKGTIDFNPDEGAGDTLQLTSTPGSRGSSYLTRYDTSGNFIAANTLAASGEGDQIKAIVTDDSNHLYIAGEFNGSADFNFSPLPADTFNLRSAGSEYAPDIFFAKYKGDTLIYARKIGNADFQTLSGMAIDSSSLNIFGRFGGDVIFNPVPPVDMSSRMEGGGVYLAAYRTFSPSSEKQLLAYSFSVPPATGTITVADSVLVTVPFGTDVTNLVADFTVSQVAIANVGATLQVSGETPNDFSGVVTYTVMAEDSTTRDYFVKVTIEDETGISEPGAEGNASFNVWPNPATGILYLERPSVIRIYDLQGRLQLTTGRTKSIRTDKLVPGSYILVNDTGHRKKIIIR